REPLFSVQDRDVQRFQSSEFRSARHSPGSDDVWTDTHCQQWQNHPVRAETVFLIEVDAFMRTADQNASSLTLYIGKTGLLRCEYLSIEVTVADAKRSYGRTLLLVRPVSGTGEQWVEEGGLRSIDNNP